MCTLAIAFRALADAPVAVAANRDEVLDRPSVPPRAIGGDVPAVAPGDEEAGGTWIGYNAAGVFAGLTNRWTDADLAGERSRGLLVRDALGRGSAGDAARAVERALAEDEYEGFYLVLADADEAVLFEWDGGLRVAEFDPGVHVVMNAGYDDEFDDPGTSAWPDEVASQAESARAVRRTLRPEPGETAGTWLDRAAGVLGDHGYGVCVHGDGYGTRSSSLIALHDDGGATYRFADGPPCEAAFEAVDEEI